VSETRITQTIERPQAILKLTGLPNHRAGGHRHHSRSQTGGQEIASREAGGDEGRAAGAAWRNSRGRRPSAPGPFAGVGTNRSTGRPLWMKNRRVPSKSLRSINELLSDVEPVGKEELLAREQCADTVAFEIRPYPDRFPVPDIVRFIMISRGCTDLGAEDKVAWQYPFTHNGWLCIVYCSTFGLRLRVWCPENAKDAAQSWANQFEGRLYASQRSAEAQLQDLADQQIRAGNVTLQNQYSMLRSTYEYFREGAQLALAGQGRIPVRSPDGGYRLMAKEEEAFYNVVAMCSAFFSELEHVLVLSLPFMPDRKHLEQVSIRDFIGMTWADKYARVLGTGGSGAAQEYFTRLVNIAERYRNTYGHGAFGKDAATIYFHVPDVGAIPCNMTEVSTQVRKGPQYLLIPIGETDFTKVCEVFDGWEADIAAKLLWPAWTWIQAGLDVRYDAEFIQDVGTAIAEGQFPEFVERACSEWERHANMEY
jgi:hypothetical protein